VNLGFLLKIPFKYSNAITSTGVFGITGTKEWKGKTAEERDVSEMVSEKE